MTVIIPAWSRDATALNDTPVVKLAQLFMDNQVATQLLLLQPLPWLRYQLQANHLTQLPWWNVFDALQGVTRATGLPLGLEDLDLPADTQFAYLAHTVLLYRHDRIYGEVHFHPAGFVSEVDLTTTTGQQIVKVYDDRGFCSTQTTYDAHHHRLEKLWFSPTRQPKMRQVNDTTIQVLGPDGQPTRTVASLETLITTTVQQHLAQRHDLLIADANPATATILTQLAHQHRVAYLLSTQRAPTLPDDLLRAVERVIVPTKQMVTKFSLVNADVGTPIDVISPYATTLSLGHSTELPATTLVWTVNHLTTTAQQTVASQLVAWLTQAETNQLAIITTSQRSQHALEQDLRARLLAHAQVDLESPQAQIIDLLWTQIQRGQGVRLTDWPQAIQDVLTQRQRVTLQVHLTDNAREQLLGQARLLIDLGPMPDLQLQIAAISAGIPQINATATGYVTDHQNGLIIQHPRDLTQSLDFYLKTLVNWNQSLVSSITALENLAEPKLLAYWREVIDYGEHTDASRPTGRPAGHPAR